MLRNTLKAGILGLSALAVLTAGSLAHAQDSSNLDLTVTAGALTLNIVETDITLDDGNSNTITVAGSTATGDATLEIEDLTGQASFSVVTNATNLDDDTLGTTFIYLQDELAAPTNTFYSILNSAYTTVGGPHDINAGAGTGSEFTKYESVQTISTLTSFAITGTSNDFNVLDKASGLTSGSGSYELTQTQNIDLPAYGCYTTGNFADPNQACLVADAYTGTLTFKTA